LVPADLVGREPHRRPLAWRAVRLGICPNAAAEVWGRAGEQLAPLLRGLLPLLRRALRAEQGQVLLRALAELRRGSRERDPSLDQDQVTVAQLEKPAHLLVDDQRGGALRAQAAERRPDLLARDGRHALGRPLEADPLRIGWQ